MTKIFRIGLVSLAVVLVGCGTNQAIASPQLALISAASKTTDANTAQMSLTVASAGESSSTKVNISAEGAFSFTDKKGQLTEQVTSGTTTTPVTINTVVDGSLVYEKLPASLAGLTGSTKPWIKIDTAAIAKSQGVDSTGLASSGTTDPTQGLTMITAASTNVTVVGKETLRGAKTTHYKADLDFAKAAAAEKDATRKAALDKLAQAYGNKTLPADVWIDSDGRVRKMAYSLNTANVVLQGSTTTTPADAANINLTVEFYNFGTPVNVSVPAASDVTDLSSLTGAAGGLGQS